MLRFSLTHPMDVLTIPAAYQLLLFLFYFLFSSFFFEKEINKKVLNSRTHLMLVSFCVELLL